MPRTAVPHPDVFVSHYIGLVPARGMASPVVERARSLLASWSTLSRRGVRSALGR